MSVDQYLARPDGSLDWLERFNDPAAGDAGYGAFFSTVDTVVLGRSTFDTVLGFDQWPYGGKRVVVFSHRALEHEGVEVASGPLASVLTSLRARGSQHVYLDGGQLVRQGLQENVVDLLTLSVVPHVLGSGRPLFAQGLPELRLTLLGSQVYPNGLVQLRYQRADWPSDQDTAPEL
jgi:dihydrofolate reductase